MGLDEVASRLTSALPLSCLVFDFRGFGSSDTLPSQPRLEVIPSLQCSDLRDAVTFAQTTEEVDKDRIGLWGYSFSGVPRLVSRRCRSTRQSSDQPGTNDGWMGNLLRLARPDLVQRLNQGFEMDRISPTAGNPPTMLPVVSADPHGPCDLPLRVSHEFFSAWEHEKSAWKNELTLRSAEELVRTSCRSRTSNISRQRLSSWQSIQNQHSAEHWDEVIRKTQRAQKLCVVDGHHYEMLGSKLDSWHRRQVAFLSRTLCKA